MAFGFNVQSNSIETKNFSQVDIGTFLFGNTKKVKVEGNFTETSEKQDRKKRKKKGRTMEHPQLFLFIVVNNKLIGSNEYLREDLAVNVRPSSQSSGKLALLSSSSTVSLSTSLM